jgi:hypothetical protein
MRWSTFLAALIFALGPTLPTQAGDAPPATADSAPEALRMYDLTDLIGPRNDFPLHALLPGRTLTGTFTPAQHAAPAAPQEANPEPALAGVLREFFEPAIADLLRSRCVLRNGTLFVTAKPALHRHVEGALALARRQRQLQITTHTTLYAMPPQHRQTRYALPGFAWRTLAGQPEAAIADLTPGEQGLLISGFRGDQQVMTLQSPTVTTFSGQLAHSSNVKQFPYYTPVFTAKGPALDRSVLTFGDGMELRTTATSDLLFTHLELTQVRVTLLDTKPIPWEGGDAEVRPVIPVTATSTIRIDQALANGHGVVVATGPFRIDDHDQPLVGFLIVDCTILDGDARSRQAAAFQERKAELKAALQNEADAKAAQHKETAPPASKGADNF